MSGVDFVGTVHRLSVIANQFEEIDIDTFLERVADTEAMVPLIDPTPNQHGGERLRIIREFAEEARRFKAKAQEFKRRLSLHEQAGDRKLLEPKPPPEGTTP